MTSWKILWACSTPFLLFLGAVPGTQLSLAPPVFDGPLSVPLAGKSRENLSSTQTVSVSETPLHKAVRSGNVNAVKELLAQDANVNSRDDQDKTPLMVACSAESPNLQIVRLLVSHGADLRAMDRQGDTALHFSLKSGNAGVVTFLLASGADPFSKNRQGKTALETSSGTSKTRVLVQQFMSLVRHPLRMVKPTSVLCDRPAYKLEAGSVRGWSTKDIGRLFGPLAWTKTPTARDCLGPFGQQAVTLKLSDLRPHKYVRVQLELFVIGSWDGNGDGAGPDILDIRVPGVGTLLHSTFFCNTEDDRAGLPLQSFPDPYPLGFHHGYNGADSVKTLGYVQIFPRDAVYKVDVTFADKRPDLEIVLSGLTVPQGTVVRLMQDESWGIGGLVVKTDG